MYVVCMSKEIKRIEKGISQEDIDRILEEGVQCGALVEIGECVDCLLGMFDGIQSSQLVREFKLLLGPQNDNYVDQFMMLLLVSEVATLTANFRNREKEEDVGKA